MFLLKREKRGPGVILVFAAEIKNLPPADLPLFNLKLVLVSGHVWTIFLYLFMHRARCLDSQLFHKLLGKVMLVV